MIFDDLLAKPLWQMTGEEFLQLNRFSPIPTTASEQKPPSDKSYKYGIAGIAEIFGCSIPTANRIKKSGRIDAAITQVGRKIVVDVEKAIELASRQPSQKRR